MEAEARPKAREHPAPSIGPVSLLRHRCLHRDWVHHRHLRFVMLDILSADLPALTSEEVTSRGSPSQRELSRPGNKRTSRVNDINVIGSSHDLFLERLLQLAPGAVRPRRLAPRPTPPWQPRPTAIVARRARFHLRQENR